MPPVAFWNYKNGGLGADRTKTTVCYGIHRRVRPEPRIVRSKQGLELFVHKQPPVNVLAVWGGKRLYMMVVSVSFPYFIIQFEIGRLYTL